MLSVIISMKMQKKHVGENQPNAGYGSKPNGSVLKLGGCN